MILFRNIRVLVQFEIEKKGGRKMQNASLTAISKEHSISLWQNTINKKKKKKTDRESYTLRSP